MTSTAINAKKSMRGNMTFAIATLIAVTVGAFSFVLGTGTAKADCYTSCYDYGNTGYHCTTNCN